MPVVPEQGLAERMPFACAQGVESQALFLKPANIRGTKSRRYRVRTYAMDKRLSLVHPWGSSELCQVSKALRLSPPHSLVARALLRTPHKESAYRSSSVPNRCPMSHSQGAVGSAVVPSATRRWCVLSPCGEADEFDEPERCSRRTMQMLRGVMTQNSSCLTSVNHATHAGEPSRMLAPAIL